MVSRISRGRRETCGRGVVRGTKRSEMMFGVVGSLLNRNPPRPSLRSERATPVRHEGERRMIGVVGSLFDRNRSCRSLQRSVRPVRVGRLVHAHRFQHEGVASDGLVLCALSVPHGLLGMVHARYSTAKQPYAALTGGGTARGACLLRFSVRSWARWAVLPTRKTGSSYGGNDSR